MGANDSEHIWLQQSVTFTVDGQTRTLEIGIPVPRNATAQDVETILDVANMGMKAITQRIDAQLAGLLAKGAPALPAADQQNVSPNGRAPVEAMPSPTTEPAATKASEASKVTDADVTAALDDTAPTPTSSMKRPTPPTPTPGRPAPGQRTSVEPARSQPSTGPAPAPGEAIGEMTRPQFLTAAAELGLNPRQAMDHLGVRSLEGLNLREALESLRRRLLGVSPTAEPEPEIAPAGAASSTTARYFEEEDDEDTILYTIDEEVDTDEDDTIGATSEDGGDELDLDDLPDLAPPAAPAPRQRPAPTARKSQSTVHETPAPAPEPAPESGARTRAMQLIGKLRAANGGGPASDYQRNAYHNIVEDELGKAPAATLVRGLWRTTTDHLSSAQVDALIRWGKQDEFAEEAALVLAALKAEQRRAEQAETASKDANQPTAPRSATRSRPAGESR